jgi:hypothetical protein
MLPAEVLKMLMSLSSTSLARVALSALPHFFVGRLGIAEGQQQDCGSVFWLWWQIDFFVCDVVWWAGMHEVSIEHLLGSRNAPHHEGICGFDTNSKKVLCLEHFFLSKNGRFLLLL